MRRLGSWRCSQILIFGFTAALLSGCKTETDFIGSPAERKVRPQKEISDVIDPKPTPVSPRPSEPWEELNPKAVDLMQARQSIVETFVQESMKSSDDILLVVDDSQSMKEEQNNLSSKLNALLKYLGKTDWQIGVITTSAIKKGNDYTCKLTLVKSSDPDANTRFTKAVQAGTDGAGNEQGILQAVVGLRCPEQPWVREKSTLAVLILSDEDNCSNGEDCQGSPAASELYLTSFVEKDLGRMVGINVGFYGIYQS